MKMHLQATENLPNAKFSRGVVPLGRGIKNAEAGWKLRRRKICSRCLREDKLVRQMITHFGMIKVENATQIRDPHEGK